jgi:hypothetical protein
MARPGSHERAVRDGQILRGGALANHAVDVDDGLVEGPVRRRQLDPIDLVPDVVRDVARLGGQRDRARGPRLTMTLESPFDSFVRRSGVSTSE